MTRTVSAESTGVDGDHSAALGARNRLVIFLQLIHALSLLSQSAGRQLEMFG